MKRFLPLFLLPLLALFALTAAAETPNGQIIAAVYDYDEDCYGSASEMPVVALELDDSPLDGEISALIYDSRTLAPLRLISEALGAQVTWLPEGAQVQVEKGETNLVFTLGSSQVLVNGEVRELPDGVPATLVRHEDVGYTMIPLRFFSEALGCKVEWDQGSYTATLVRYDYIAPLLEGLGQPEVPGETLIALDAGHGGSASGAYYEKVMEKDLNLTMTRLLDRILWGLGYQTMLTRQGDVYMDLYDRAYAANEAGADLFVSIHCNAADHHPDYQGLYVYHYPDSESGEVLAQSIQTAACAATGAIDRQTAAADFVVLRETAMPSVLVETGFMSCHEELQRLRDKGYQESMARGIAQGITRYCSGQNAAVEKNCENTIVN